MEFLKIILLLPLLSNAQRYETPFNYQDEPFLPIFPVYPYTPKLVKRGAEKDVIQLNSDLYPPKPDARDSYSPNFTGTYHRNNQNPYLKQDLLQQGSSSSIRQQNPSELFIPGYSQNVNQDYTRADTNPGLNIYSPQYNANTQAYSSVPSPFYNGYQTILIPQQIAATLYSNYNYQGPFPNYRPTSFAAQITPQTSQTQAAYSEGPNNVISQDEKKEESKNEQFLDGNNYLARDLDGQSSIAYKVPTASNQIDNMSDLHVRNAPFPNSGYSLINMGQSQSHFTLPQDYNYQYGQLMDSFVKLMPENADIYRNQYKNTIGSVRTQTPNLPVIAKTGLAYVMTPQFHVTPRHVKSEGQVRSGHFGKAQKSGASSLETMDYAPENAKGVADPVNYTQLSKLFNAQKNVQKYQNNEDFSSVYPSPQAYTYQYTGYNGGQSPGQGNYKTTLDDVNFGVKGSLKNLFMS